MAAYSLRLRPEQSVNHVPGLFCQGCARFTPRLRQARFFLLRAKRQRLRAFLKLADE